MEFEQTVTVFDDIELLVKGNYESSKGSKDEPPYFECDVYGVYAISGQEITDIISERVMKIIEDKLAEILP
jgi:hypothetical protein